jgi:hypothetical protein
MNIHERRERRQEEICETHDRIQRTRDPVEGQRAHRLDRAIFEVVNMWDRALNCDTYIGFQIWMCERFLYREPFLGVERLLAR